MNTIPPLKCDGYKLDHRRQYPFDTLTVVSGWTARMSRIPGVDKVVVFGLQYFIQKYIIDDFNDNFFTQDIDDVCEKYKRRVNGYLGPNQIGDQHLRDLHALGYMPLLIRALPEGTLCPIGVPMLTIRNTEWEMFWLTNFLETIMSCILWKPMTSATIATQYYKEFKRHADLTGSPEDFIQWQGHDFSFRGMSGLEDACMSGAGHLLTFTGTDTIPAIDFLEEYYGANCEKELIGGSVAATEHSVMSMGKKENEIDTFRRLITETYPNGIVSIVSDTWDFWKVMTEYLVELKPEIMARDGRVVIRPDSGTPEDIICGVDDDRDHNRALYTEAQYKGAYEIMWDIFGGTINEKGYKVLDPHIGLIYGDSITLDRQKVILSRLEKKGFAASNLVLGIGSFTYEYVTRDTFGFAMKATYGELWDNEKLEVERREIFKDPKTDSGFKKSARGLMMVVKNESGQLVLKDRVTPKEENSPENLLEIVFKDGELIEEFTLANIRERLKSQM
jgi:nicotinamide phosphoribosyltransferase